MRDVLTAAILAGTLGGQKTEFQLRAMNGLIDRGFALVHKAPLKLAKDNIAVVIGYDRTVVRDCSQPYKGEGGFDTTDVEGILARVDLLANPKTADEVEE